MKRFWILFKTELKLALRSPDAIIFSLAMPVVILVVVALIYDSTGIIEQTFGAFIAIGICAIGLAIASTAKDIKRAGIMCSIIYFPMLLFSGTTIPFHVFPEPVQLAAKILPLRQGIILLNGISNGISFAQFWPQLLVLASIAVVSITVSLITFRWDMELS